MSEGFVSLNNESDPVPITILRDTGATWSLLLQDTLPFSCESATGESILAQGIQGSFVNVPLHKIELKSDLVTGSVIVGIRPTLPVKGVSFLLGNDLAGSHVIADPHVIYRPSTCEGDTAADADLAELYPSCVVTRALKKNST